MIGIDVSTLQGNINWGKVREKVDFAMVKASQGRGETKATKNLRNFTDSCFTKNMNGAASAELPVGVYHYMTAQNEKEAVAEADYFIKVITPCKEKLSLWAAVDVESEQYLKGLGKPELTAIVRAFLDRTKKAGYRPMLYTNPNFLTYRFEKDAFLSTDIWLAHWGVKKPMQVRNLQIWQHSIGRVSGINTDVDLDTGYFDMEKFAKKPDDTMKYHVGGKYTMVKGDRYTTGAPVPERLIGRTFVISAVKTGRILLDEITSWVKV